MAVEAMKNPHQLPKVTFIDCFCVDYHANQPAQREILILRTETECLSVAQCHLRHLL
jgi:hypothetical protein